jgi:shikimate kinase
MLSFKHFIGEGVNDPAIFKAVFLAGGPGSGKSFIVGKTGLPALGYRVVNSDDAFEAAMRKAGLKMSPENIFSVQGQELRGRAKELTGKKEQLYIQGRLGLVIDGTGKDVEKVKKQIVQVKKLGYDVAMIFVNTDLETALERNRQRERSLPDAEVETYWKDVQKNVGAFQQLFGSANFHVVDNSRGKDFRNETLRAYKDISKFTKTEVKNNIAKDWIDQERKRK